MSFAWTENGFSVMLLYIEVLPAFGLAFGSLVFPGFLPGFGLPESLLRKRFTELLNQ